MWVNQLSVFPEPTITSWTPGHLNGENFLAISLSLAITHDNVSALRLGPPLQRKLQWIAVLKVIRLHWTRGSLLMSLPSVPTNQAAPPEDCLPVRWDEA